jgi:hypothetical protein
MPRLARSRVARRSLGGRLPGFKVTPETDGFAIAALTAGLVQAGPVAIVLGAVALRRVARSGREGRGLAAVGIILGAITTALFVVFTIVVGVGVLGDIGGLKRSYGDDAALDQLWDQCEAGDMLACDDLYRGSIFGSEYEEFGKTCGFRTTGEGLCGIRP